LGCFYVAFQVTREALREAVAAVRALGILGLNVTMPLKTAIVEHLDRLESTARFVEAVNTVVNREGVLTGFNTDGAGALNVLTEARINLEGEKVILLGAGGAARAIAYNLVHACGSLAILNRTVEKAVALAELVRARGEARVAARPLTQAALAEELRDSSLLVNATSLGMRPLEAETPVPRELLRRDLAVFDLVYDPANTRFLAEAREVGARTIDGVSMLVHQGAESFRIWTGREAPVAVMMRAARQALPP